MKKVSRVVLGFLLATGIGCGGLKPSDVPVEKTALALTVSWDGWLDGSGQPPTLVADATAPSGGPVQQIDRATSGGDYFSPWQTVVPGQDYCLQAAVKWVGGGAPFVGVQPTGGNVIWVMGAASYSDTLGPVATFSTTDTGWQHNQFTVSVPSGVTQMRLVTELFAGAPKGGADLAYFDNFSLTSGACAASSVAVPYSEQFESGAGNWTDKSGIAPSLASDNTSPAGPAVMSVTRATSGGDYFSPWIEVTSGQSYCAKAAVNWQGGGSPFVGIQPSNGPNPIWIIGAAGYADAFGPVQVVSSTQTGWQQFQSTITMPAGATQARFSVELYSGVIKDGSNAATFDGFSLTSGACVASVGLPLPYTEKFESGNGNWTDKGGTAPSLGSDSSSPAGPGVMGVTRAMSGGDYSSPWIDVTGGQPYCVNAAVNWQGGGSPFVGVQPSNGANPIWIIGAAGYADAFGPVQAVSPSQTGWQQFHYTVAMPAGATQARLWVELYSGVSKGGSDAATFDGFSLTSGACVPYSEQFESGAGSWTDQSGTAPSLTTDSSSPAGPTVMNVTRATSGGDYSSPWIGVTGGQTYCAKAAVNWQGGGAPFVGIQPSNGPNPIWIIGAAGYADAFGPVQAVSPTQTGWQQFQYTVSMPAGATQARLAVELFSGATKASANAATFDGFSLTSGVCGPSSILVMAPHPDDDVITSAGVIERAMRRGEQVHVAYLTNGDFNGTDEGATRQNEAVASQNVLGMSEDNLFFLGYPDGYTFDLRETYTASTDVMTTPNGVSHTYAAHGLGRTDYHSHAFGSPAAYNWANVVGDVANLLGTMLPDAIFVTAGNDDHPDHQSAYFAIVQALPQVFASHPSYKPTIYTTYVWPDDFNWPNAAAPDQYFSAPSTIASLGVSWSNRNSLDVPLSMQTTTLETNLKYLSIAEEVSQGGNEVGGYIGLFLHKDEFFWGERPAAPGNLPPVVNAGLDQAVSGGAAVTLDGSGSFDPESVPLAYQWVQADGPAVALSNPMSARPTFTAPSNLIWPVTLTFELQVADGLGWSVPDSVSVIVNPTTTPTDVALNATAVASSEDTADGQTADKAIDGVLQGYANGDPTHEWVSNGEGAGAWIELTWTTPQLVTRIVLHDRPNPDDQVLSGTLLLSNGTTIPVGALNNDGLGNVFDFTPTLITKVRFTVNSVSDTTLNVGLEEFEVYNLPGGT
jgi:LmbE family N-acetylglucosaminyl deacetylase